MLSQAKFSTVLLQRGPIIVVLFSVPDGQRSLVDYSLAEELGHFTFCFVVMNTIGDGI